MMMGGAGVLFMLFLWAIGILILIAVIRYAIDSSRTSQKLDDLVHEIHMLRKEMKENQKTSLFDKKI